MLRRNRHGRLQVSGLYVRFLRIDFYKLFLNLLVLTLFGFIVWSAVKLFSGGFLSSPLIGSLVFFIEIVAFVLLCRHARANRWRPPNIVVTALVIIAMLVVMAFAGVHPISNYKDRVVSDISGFIKNSDNQSKVTVIAPEKENLQTGTYDNENNTESDTGTKVIPTITSYETIFNDYRIKHGLHSLVFTPELNNLAQQRAIEIQTDFSHAGIMKYNLGENIAMGVYSDREALGLWDSSPGHKSNMLDPSYTKTGYCRNGKYAVQLFSW
jgi:hypothetical protein